MQARKGEVVTANVKGVEFLFKKNKVDLAEGQRPDRRRRGASRWAARNTRPSTSSSRPAARASPLPGVEVDEKTIVTSTGALELDRVPGHLVVIGGGYIGLELGSVWKRLGAEVTVVEFLDRLVPGMDAEVARDVRARAGQAGDRSSASAPR